MPEQFATIFDMDGVLVDSYQSHFESWRMMAQNHGLVMTEADFKPTFGRTSRETIATLWANRQFSPEEIAAMDHEKEAAFRDLVTKDFPAMDGAKELIAALHAAGFGVAVGSSGPRDNVNFVVDRLGVRSLMGAIVSGSDVRHGKPDPEIFLSAAKKLGVPPERCVVIEDATVGLRAARSAGMKCVGLVSTGRTHEELAAADMCVDSLRELSPEVLRQVISDCGFGPKRSTKITSESPHRR